VEAERDGDHEFSRALRILEKKKVFLLMLNTWHPNVKKINVIHIPFPQEFLILKTPSGAQTLACGTLLQGTSYSYFFDNFHHCHGVCEGHAIPYFVALQLDTPRIHGAILYVDREESTPRPYQKMKKMTLEIILIEGHTYKHTYIHQRIRKHLT
jgi:hypothetical protein